jgi:polysaccharide deacetylase 2 family uncharacterized protein YibQ
MAPPSKKSGRSSSGRTNQKKPKNTTLRKASRKKRTVKKKKRSGMRRSTLVALVFVAMVSLVGVGYCLGTCWLHETESQVSHKKVVAKKTHSVQKKESRPSKEKPKAKQVVEKVQGPPPAIQKSVYKKSKLAYRGERPRLAIIIDDVHTRKQLQAIQDLPMPVTPSIFPPYTQAPHTPRLATQAVHYMIHLPMESGNARFDRQTKTLKTDFTQAQMEERLHELRRLFPRAHYINNHTGSRFTANDRAMRKFYEAMKKEGFTFIDSRTTGKSKAGRIAHRYGDDYVARDVFLDNVKSVPAIHTQLKKAVRLAKKNGYAIAIGHPYTITMQALSKAKPLLKEVEVVYIDEIFREE